MIITRKLKGNNTLTPILNIPVQKINQLMADALIQSIKNILIKILMQS